jgi:hypothetical protein
LPDAFPFFRRIVVSSALRNDGKASGNGIERINRNGMVTEKRKTSC